MRVLWQVVFHTNNFVVFIISGVSKIGGINEDTSVAVEDLIDERM